jgi:AcrR family transcriptional regulator
MTAQAGPGRVNQKQRTRTAILAAARALIGSGVEITMPAVARTALVSEATAYRYFPDLVSLLREAIEQAFPAPAEALAPVAHVTDPAERVRYAAELLFRDVLAAEAAVRAMISASVVRPGSALPRPARRFGLIDEALRPLTDPPARSDPAVLAQLRLDLAVVVSAEAVLNLMDLCGLSPDEAVASAAGTARRLTAAAVAAMPGAG